MQLSAGRSPHAHEGALTLSFDIDRARRETRGVADVVHFNNAGSSLMPDTVYESQVRYLDLEAHIGGYEAAAREAGALQQVYGSIANLIGAAPDEIALVENATVAWDMAFYALKFEPGDRILTAQAEYAANYVAYLHVAGRSGVVIDVIPNNEHGETCPDALEEMIDERVKLISITHVPTNGGLVNPAAKIGAVANRHGIPYLLDACQAVGQMPVDVKELGCDILSATGRKYLRGPRGTGFLYVRRGLIESLHPPMIDHFSADWTAPDRYELRKDARRFENWENNYGLRLGLGVAVDYAADWGLDAIWERVQALATRVRRGLGGIETVTVHDIGRVQCGIVSFSVDGVSPEQVKAALAARKINVSISDPSSTLLDSMARSLTPLVRASVHYYNDEQEVDRLIDVVGKIADGSAPVVQT